MSRTIDHDGRASLLIRFRFDRALVDLVKTLPRRRWMALDKLWQAPDDDVVEVVDRLAPHGFECDERVARLYADRGGTGDVRLRTAAAAPPAAEPPLLGLFEAPSTGATPSDDRRPATSDGSDDDWSVSDLNAAVADAIAARFPSAIWIVGEISGWNKRRANRRYLGFELVERDDDGREKAKVAALLWEDDRRILERKIAEAGDPFALEDEIGVRVRVRVELFERWGLYRLRVQDIDVGWTLGEAARRREEIVRRLVAEGLAERNRSLPLPAAPLAVGLVTSLGSDAYSDVLRTLQESGFAFRVVAHGARVQGPSTEPSVLNALDRLRDPAHGLDVVLICRGGGSRTDLAWFDTEALGRAVATYPVPVVVGIGHEQDVSVLDAVARPAKTPTAAAALLVDRVRETADRIDDLGETILERAAIVLRQAKASALDRATRVGRAARFRLGREGAALSERRARLVRGGRATIREAERTLVRRMRDVPRAAQVRVASRSADLERVARQLLSGARRDVGEAIRRVAEIVARLRPAAERATGRECERLRSRRARLRLGDPRRVVERGYAILRGERGVVTSTEDAPAGAEVRAEVRDGRLRLRSEGTENDA